MDITSQSYVSLQMPPPPFAGEAAAERDVTALSDTSRSDELVSSQIHDHYTPSSPSIDDGVYTRDSVMKKLRETQDALLHVAQTDGELPIDGEKLSQMREKKDLKDPNNPNDLDEGDKELVKRLEQRDSAVRLHEQTHAAIAGKYAEGPPTYSYQMGPDGKMYAIGGSLAVDTGKEADPAENRNKARILQAAALGVAEPSAADSVVAMQAATLVEAGASPLGEHANANQSGKK